MNSIIQEDYGFIDIPTMNLTSLFMGYDIDKNILITGYRNCATGGETNVKRYDLSSLLIKEK